MTLVTTLLITPMQALQLYGICADNLSPMFHRLTFTYSQVFKGLPASQALQKINKSSVTEISLPYAPLSRDGVSYVFNTDADSLKILCQRIYRGKLHETLPSGHCAIISPIVLIRCKSPLGFERIPGRNASCSVQLLVSESICTAFVGTSTLCHYFVV